MEQITRKPWHVVLLEALQALQKELGDLGLKSCEHCTPQRFAIGTRANQLLVIIDDVDLSGLAKDELDGFLFQLSSLGGMLLLQGFVLQAKLAMLISRDAHPGNPTS